MAIGADISSFSAAGAAAGRYFEVNKSNGAVIWRGAAVTYVYAEGTGWPPHDNRQPAWESADYTVVLGEGEDETVFHYGRGSSAESASAIYAVFLKALERGLKVDVTYTRAENDTPVIVSVSLAA